jgi:hypothetical protein
MYSAAATSMCVLQRQTAGHKSVRNQKVLWPAYCIKGLGRFPDSSSKRSVGAHITRFTTCFTCGPTCWYQNLVQIQYELQSSLSRCILKTVQFPSLPNSLPCPKPTFSRTSGHCVGTCRATKCPVTFPATLQLSNTNTCVQTGQCVTCCLQQHCWDWASEVVVWINLQNQWGNTWDLAFGMISVLLKPWNVSSLTRHKTCWQ